MSFRPGLPNEETLRGYRIWDSYFTPAHSLPGRDGIVKFAADMDRALPAIRLGQFERLCYFAHVGIGTTRDAQFEQLVRKQPDVVLRPLSKWPQLLAMIQLNASDIRASLDAMNRWLRDGPMLGVYFSGSGPHSAACTSRELTPLIERAIELKAVIMQHTWFVTGGKLYPGASTPAELAEVAGRYPEQEFVCAHAGGEWEQGIRAVARSENVLLETSGFDATAGFIEMAVREVGAGRIVFGSHLPSRSLGTELAKVVAAEITEPEKRLILGENFRRLLQPILGGKRK